MEKKRTRSRKIPGKLAAGMVCVGALSAVVGGTMAYLTDHKEAVNTFTVGKVSIEGEEPGWNPDGDDKPGGIAKDVQPVQSWKKDPRIRNTGKNDAYVYMEVSVPVADAVYVDADGIRANKGKASHIELFEFDGRDNVSQTMQTGIGVSEQNDSWSLLYKKEVDGNMVYTFCYNEILSPGKTTDTLFDRITFANLVEGQLDGQTLDVTVGYYAIQTLNTGGGEKTVPEQAKHAFDKYIVQNLGQDGAVVNANGLDAEK